MSSEVKYNLRKRKKLNVVPKPKQPRRVKKPKRNWLELPSDLMLNILQRLGVVDILENAQKVCTAWREICNDPAMWRVIFIDRFIWPSNLVVGQEMCKLAVDKSQGQLVDLTVVGFFDRALLQYVADRSTQLRRLVVAYYVGTIDGIPSEAFKKFSSLEELSLVRTIITKDNIEAIGRYCPLLKTLKLNQDKFNFWDGDEATQNEIALAIGKNLPQLTHLQLIGNSMQNIGLRAILDGCCHLESLDLRGCVHIDLKGYLGKKCSQQIKYLRFPHESLKDYVDENVNLRSLYSSTIFE